MTDLSIDGAAPATLTCHNKAIVRAAPSIDCCAKNRSIDSAARSVDCADPSMACNIGAPESTCSADLHIFVKEVFSKYTNDDVMKKFVGIGSDGASNMRGPISGLAERLRQDPPIL